MKKELKKIHDTLVKNGWSLDEIPKADGDMPLYTKMYNDHKMGIYVSLEEISLGAHGYYGVCDVQIMRYAYDTFSRDDLRDMNNLLSIVENDLISIKIPFRPTYGFGSQLESNLGINFYLRKAYDLDRLEAKGMIS